MGKMGRIERICPLLCNSHSKTFPCTSICGFLLVAHCSELILWDVISDFLNVIIGGWNNNVRVGKNENINNREGMSIRYSQSWPLLTNDNKSYVAKTLFLSAYVKILYCLIPFIVLIAHCQYNLFVKVEVSKVFVVRARHRTIGHRPGHTL